MGIKFSPEDSELYRRTDEVLHYIWDPIGVAEIPTCRDEYRSYLPQVFKRLKTGNKEEIVEYLMGIENKCMELFNHRTHNEHVADILLEWKKKIENNDS